MTSDKTLLVMLAAGGTGGHLFPAEALAHELTARGHRVHLVTDDRAERFAGRFPAEAIHTVSSATIGSRNPIGLVHTFLALWKGSREAGAIYERYRPSVVVGFGGYPTLPPLWSATRRGIPTIIHEQNAVMGRANKALAARVNAIAGGFLESVPGETGRKVVLTGNPVRPGVIEASSLPYPRPESGGAFRLLVFGGSQGAKYFSEVVPAALRAMPEHFRRRIRLTQQARAEDRDVLAAACAELGVDAEISPFFADMPARMAAAHLVLSRSGASTVSEIAVIGRPAILVPYPHALDHDQAANAAALARTGAVLVRRQAELDGEALAGLIEELAGDPERLAGMAAAARGSGRPDAASALADLTQAVASGQTVAEFVKGAGA